MNVNTAANAVNTANVTNGANVAKYIIPGISEKSIRNYNGKRVFTFKDVDTFFSLPEGRASSLFYRYKEMFSDNDYIWITYPDTKHMGIEGSRCNLLTASGVNKILNKAVHTAFRVENTETSEVKSEESKTANQKDKKPKIKFHKMGFYFEKTYKGKKVVTLDDIAAFTGINKSTARVFFNRSCYIGKDFDFLRGDSLAEFFKENPKCTKCTRLIVVYQSGYEKLCEHYGATDAVEYFDSVDIKMCDVLNSSQDSSVDEALHLVRQHYKIESFPFTSPYACLLPEENREKDVFVKVADNICFVFYNEEKLNEFKDKFLVELVRGLIAKEA